MTDYHLESYQKHQGKQFDEKIINTWSQENSVDAWRHNRMYRNLEPLLKEFPKSTWVTVGDGRYGTDAHFIAQHGNEVLATDIRTDLLERSSENGYIKQFQEENAENLSFKDRSFDFVLCKESYHHFPRPMVALYEMIRVARLGVILMEPNDDKALIPQKQSLSMAAVWFWQAAKNRVKKVMGREPFYAQGQYEESGNYVYTISPRELEKVGLGLNLPLVATTGLNDHYIEGAEFELFSENGPIQKEIKKVIAKMDRACKRGVRPWALLNAIIFKSDPGPTCRKTLESAGYQLNNLQSNPYAST